MYTITYAYVTCGFPPIFDGWHLWKDPYPSRNWECRNVFTYHELVQMIVPRAEVAKSKKISPSWYRWYNIWTIRAKRVSNCYIKKNIYVLCSFCVCATNLGFSGKKNCACVRLIFVLVWGTYYVPDTYVPGISRQKSIRTYVMFRPRTHTSVDSYIYQLSLVVATATVS